MTMIASIAMSDGRTISLASHVVNRTSVLVSAQRKEGKYLYNVVGPKIKRPSSSDLDALFKYLDGQQLAPRGYWFTETQP